MRRILGLTYCNHTANVATSRVEIEERPYGHRAIRMERLLCVDCGRTKQGRIVSIGEASAWHVPEEGQVHSGSITGKQLLVTCVTCYDTVRYYPKIADTLILGEIIPPEPAPEPPPNMSAQNLAEDDYAKMRAAYEQTLTGARGIQQMLPTSGSRLQQFTEAINRATAQYAPRGSRKKA